MDLATLAPFAAAILVVGAFAGVLAGLLGVGGGIVLVPLYFYTLTGLGYGGADVMQVCVATSLATIVVTSLRSVQSHHRRGAVMWRVLRAWAPGIVAGALGGVVLAAGLGTRGLQLAFATLGIVVGLYMALGRPDWRLAGAPPTGWRLFALSPTLGFLSVLMGIGGGSFGVPVLTLSGVAMHAAVATAAGFGVLIALPSTLAFLLTPAVGAPPFTVGSVNLAAFALTVAMTLLTAPLGAALAHRTDARRLRRVFALFLILVALNMGLEAAGVLSPGL